MADHNKPFTGVMLSQYLFETAKGDHLFYNQEGIERVQKAASELLAKADSVPKFTNTGAVLDIDYSTAELRTLAYFYGKPIQQIPKNDTWSLKLRDIIMFEGMPWVVRDFYDSISLSYRRRPSRGWAKHVRLEKAEKRRKK